MLTIEDGTGLSDADAYITIAEADAYHAKRGNETWADQDDLTKEQAIVRATANLDQKYRDNWKGVRKVIDQALGWPRITGVDNDTPLKDDEGYEIAIDAVPAQVKQAASEVALIELTERFVTQEVTKDDMVKREKIGPIETEYFGGAPSGTLFPHIDGILDQVTTGGASSGVAMQVYLTAEEVNQGSIDPYDAWVNGGYMHEVKFP